MKRHFCISYVNYYITPENDVPIADIKDVFSQNTGILMYQKGPLVVYCLAKKVGEEKFQEMLKDIYKSNRNKVIDYSVLIKYLQKYTDEKSVKFLDELIHSKGMIMINETMKFNSK